MTPRKPTAQQQIAALTDARMVVVKGTPVYLRDTPDGVRLIMFAGARLDYTRRCASEAEALSAARARIEGRVI